MSRSLVLGLGNPILGDDGIGFRLAEILDEHLRSNTDVDVLPTSLAGIRLLDEISGYERLIVLDAITTGSKPTGTMQKLEIDDILSNASSRLSVHHLSLKEILDLGRKYGLRMPEKVIIYAIEIEYQTMVCDSFSSYINSHINSYIETVLHNEFSDEKF
jgi:hydrogenase maturation protease